MQKARVAMPSYKTTIVDELQWLDQDQEGIQGERGEILTTQQFPTHKLFAQYGEKREVIEAIITREIKTKVEARIETDETSVVDEFLRLRLHWNPSTRQPSPEGTYTLYRFNWVGGLVPQPWLADPAVGCGIGPPTRQWAVVATGWGGIAKILQMKLGSHVPRWRIWYEVSLRSGDVSRRMRGLEQPDERRNNPPATCHHYLQMLHLIPQPHQGSEEWIVARWRSLLCIAMLGKWSHSTI